ncbi:MAG TPA: ATP-dependent metallopeptidase FtsH/Yme1/Tma family protein [Planctomycetes bacterium]|nr:ATP-dependent metallopeptidase FtsH/Yme1/Tma family protein [Planctomycetota bacterium]
MPDAPRRPSGQFGSFTGRWVFFILLIIAAGIMLSWGKQIIGDAEKEITYSEFVKYVEDKKIASAKIGERAITGRFVDGEPKSSYRLTAPSRESQGEIIRLLQGTRVDYSFDQPNRFWEAVIPYLILLPLSAFVVYLLFRRLMDSGSGGALSFGKARAKLVTKETVKVTFEDVAGIEEAKEEVAEIVEFLKEPERFRRLGARVPRGVLLVGSPGSGKTLLAKAIAGEAGVPFFSISGSDFVEMFVGVGASRVRDLFLQAKQHAPSIIFLDEIDAVGRRRGAGLGGGHDEREQTLNAILVEMDGFDTSDQVIIIASTNRPDVLDPALLRPGRFDRRVVVDLPDMKGREAILKVHARKLKMSENVDLAEVARMTVSFSGADLENLLNEAALLAVMRRHDVVEHEDVEEAREKVLWGKERRSRKMEDDDRRITAFHEAGHAVVAWFTPHVDNPHKITIMPRGMSFLGATMKLPEKDKYIFTRGQIQGEIDVLYGGRAAEETFCSDVSVGAADDIKRATDLIRRMVTRWGMSDRLGPLTYTDEEENVFLGYEITRQHVNSENTNREIDAEIRRISSEAFSRARNLISEYAEDVKRLAALLLDKEVLNKEQITAILGEPPDKNGVLGGSPSLPADEQGDAPEAGAADG